MDDHILRSTLQSHGLRYVGASEPGISRRRAGKGFCYRLHDGSLVRDATLLARIKALVIPPAWRDVWICIDPYGHLQATGIDQRGRKQYRYHPEWTAFRDAEKYGNLRAFAAALPALRGQVDADMRRRGLPREKVIAAVVALLERTLIRVGTPAYAKENRSYGLTTLRNRHVDIEGGTLRFDFVGKSGKAWRLSLADRRIARVMKTIQDLPGQHLLQYLDEEGHRHAVSSHDVNAYLHGHAGPEFSAKDFRTWGGTVRALAVLGEVETPDSARQRKIALNKAVDAVAAKLGNTRAVCRSCYIHPAILTSWEAGTLAAAWADVQGGKPRKGLDAEETAALRWLERHAPQA